MIKTPFRNLHYNNAAAACGLYVEQQQQIYRHYGRTKDSHYLSAKQSTNVCSSPSSNVREFPYFYAKNHELMNPMSSLNNGLNAFDYNRRAGKFHKKPDRPVRVERLHESSKGSQVNEETKHVGGAAEHSEGSNPGFLCYRPLQQEDLDYYLKNGEFPSTDGYILTGSSVSYSTPPIQDRRIPVDFNDPESSLRSAAKAFKSSPSIIRKRKQPTSGQSLNSDHDHAPSEEISNYSRNNPNNSLSSCRETKFNCIARSNARKLFLSPQKCQKL